MTALAPGCTRSLYDASLATRAYPDHLHLAPGTDPLSPATAAPRTVDIQVFRNDEAIEIYNATAHSYRDFDLWINQRYVAHVAALPAGRKITLSLWNFYDQWGGRFNAGGFWRTYEPTRVRLVEIQISADEPLVGLITIPAESED